ncbi:MAG: TIGR03960 family B12-binding radical SAM protein [Bacteriovoracaceae bacterium]|jgi:radical SAM family uncharacterized protein/radical SAM-linked protein|nr:TIGR03960 family B12-binding radical SAM protein [Bacteriovoracaceae bacterium]
MSQAESLRQNPYSQFLDSLEKPARYIGGEQDEIQKQWDSTKSKIALCFPDVYEIGMSHLGFKILYQELNESEDVLAERVFAPWPDLEKQIRERELPLVSLESFRALHEFDILGFSLQYEMTYTNILNMLELGGVALFQKNRTENDPFVICGGPCATHPEPIADFMDMVVIGDGEDLFLKLAKFISDSRLAGKNRNEILKLVSTWKGIYVPSLYETEIDEMSGLEVVSGEKQTERFFIESLKDRAIPTRSPVPHLTAIFDRFSVELSRGCTEGCRFCQAGMIYRPVRERRPEKVIDAVMEGMKRGGFDEASLTCLSTADYSAVTPLIVNLLDKMSEKKAKLGISSLRAYGLDERVFEKLAEVKNTSLTFAPEAGTERMRKVINKNISEEDLMKTTENIFSRGWQKMKLYFMIGLPTETMDDVEGIMLTGKKVRSTARFKCGVKNPQITISVSTFVPKPHTPFQWSAMIPQEEIVAKQNKLWGLAKDHRLNFRRHFSKASIMEGVIARGDRRVGRVIYRAFKKGARFDGWDEGFKYDLWMEAVAEEGLDIQTYLGTLPIKGRLPWDHIDVGITKRFLEIEWKRAVKDRLSPPCGKINKMLVHHTNLEELEKDFGIDKKKLVCYHCGIKCDLKGMVDERKEYLGELGANSTSSLDTVKKEVSEEEVMVAHNGVNDSCIKYRINFSKIGSISFISHLDLQKVMARIFRRANIEVSKSNGFNKRPLISFGPALTLGVSSLSEFFDVRVPEHWGNLDDVLGNLQLHSEKGIIFRSINEIDLRAPSIQEIAKAYKYFIPIEGDIDLDEALETVMNQNEIIISSFHAKKKKQIEKDIRPRIESLQVGVVDLDKDTMTLIDEVSPIIGERGFMALTKVFDGSSIKPIDLVKGLGQLGIKAKKPIKLEVVLH